MKKESSIAVSRRGFLKGAAALGATAALYGCGSSDSSNGNGRSAYYVEPPNLETEDYFYGTGGHNCGSKCLQKAWVKNGRIIRITSDDSPADHVNNTTSSDNWNIGASRACAKCRSYRMRIYHPGRLKYPLKQTKKRGDLSGFVRLTWDKALEEISRKHHAITQKYGPESYHQLYACGSYSGGLQGGGYNGVWAGNTTSSIPGRLLGGYANYSSDYSFHQNYHGNPNWHGHTQLNASVGGASSANIAGRGVRNVVFWGTNSLSSRHHVARSTVLACKEARKNGAKIYFIGPEFVDQGVNVATHWVQMRPYTDTALMNAMMCEMIMAAFDETGAIIPGKEDWVNYLDTIVYGFFDSPEYYIDKRPYTNGTPTSTGSAVNANQGVISYTDTSDEWTVTNETRYILSNGTVQTNQPASGSYTTVTQFWTNDSTSEIAYHNPCEKVPAVPAGRSLSAYLMGDDDRLTKARYDEGTVYVAKQFAEKQTYRNGSTCSWPIKGVPANTIVGSPTTDYMRKKDYMVRKDAEWGEKITGVPAATIRELAAMFMNPDEQGIYQEWVGAQQKQAEGVINMISLRILNIVSGNYGITGATIGNNGLTATASSAATEMSNLSRNQSAPANPTSPVISVNQWHNAIKFAFGDVLKANGYKASYIPDLDESNIRQGMSYMDDGGAKALVKWKRTGTAVDRDGDGYYIPDKSSGGILYSGYRFILNPGGNILMNQHQNPNDSREMFESIPSCGQTNDPDNADDLCIVSFDPFLSPSPRWSDYVLPAATQWEMDNRQSLNFGGNIITPVVSQPPGEALSTHNFTVKFLQKYDELFPDESSRADRFAGFGAGNSEVQLIDKFKEAYDASNLSTTDGGQYYGKSFEKALKAQFRAPTASAMTPSPTRNKTSVRNAIEAYLISSDKETKPYYLGASAGPRTGYGSQYPNGVTAPAATGRCEVYMRAIPWEYENRFKAWHGYLPEAKRGQNNLDSEGDPIAYPLTMYFNYEDYFMEAYGGVDKLPPANNRFLVTTAHDRYRAHSSMSETPYLRELTHRTRGGKQYSGNDWGTYALSEANKGSIPRLNKSIQDKDFTRASWQEVFINDEDAAALGISDGEIIEMSNPVGAVRVAAHVTKRTVRGHIGLHQGAWYDPDPVDGVDDGGCANTIMASKHSRLDHGNGQQSAMVTIKKVTF